jgi:cytochrome c556
MFSFLKPNPTKKLRKQLAKLQQEAMALTRKGDIRGSSEISAEADKIWQEIQRLEGKN